MKMISHIKKFINVFMIMMPFKLKGIKKNLYRFASSFAIKKAIESFSPAVDSWQPNSDLP